MAIQLDLIHVNNLNNTLYILDSYYQPKELIVFKKKKGVYNKYQYQSYSRKLGKLRKKYQGITKNFQIVEKNEGNLDPQIRSKCFFTSNYLLEINDKEFKSLVLQADPILQQTYSYKYFGVNNGQFGILSRRLPFQQRREIEPMAKTYQVQKQKGKFYLVAQQKSGGRSQSNKKTNQKNNIIQMNPSQDTQGQQEVFAAQNSNQIRQNIPKINTDDSHMVTHYFLPKKLQAMVNENKRRQQKNFLHFYLISTKNQQTLLPDLDKNSTNVRRQKQFIRRRKDIQLLKLQRGAYRNYGFSLTYLKQKKLQESKRMKKLLTADFPKPKGITQHKTSYSNCLNRLNNFLDDNKYGIHEYVLHKDILNYQKDKTKVPRNQLYKYFLKVLSTAD